MPNQILTIKDSLVGGFSEGFATLTRFIPSLVGAVVVLVVGWMIAGIVARILEQILHKTRFESMVSRIGTTGYLQQAFGPHFTTAHLLGEMAKWFIRLIFVQAAAALLSMPHVTAIINSIILFIPNLFIAVLIMVVGALAAQVSGRLVEAAVSRSGVANPRLFSLIARYGIMGFATIAAINQVGIANNLLSILFAGLVGSIALAVGLAFGLGGQSVAQDMTRSWYERTKGSAASLKVVDTSGPGNVQNK